MIETQAGFNKGSNSGGCTAMPDDRFDGPDGTGIFLRAKKLVECIGFNIVFDRVTTAVGLDITDR